MSATNLDSTDHESAASAGAIGNSRKPRSGGPSSPEGKARSRMNALKHGAYAKLPILRTENEQAYHEFLDLYYTHFSPTSEIERRQVAQLASIDWRLARFINIETQAIDSKLDDIHQNPYAPEAQDHLKTTVSALNAALAQPALAFAGQREVALVRVREITLRTLLSLRRHHQPLDSTPAFLIVSEPPSNDERTAYLIDSKDTLGGTN